jgi:hypothetical protein
MNFATTLMALHNTGGLPHSDKDWMKASVLMKPEFSVPLAPKPVPPIAYSYQPIIHFRKIGVGHFAFALVSEVQGGLQLTLMPNVPAFQNANAEILLSEQLKPDGSVRVPCYTGATFASNFTLAPGTWLPFWLLGLGLLILAPSVLWPLLASDGADSSWLVGWGWGWGNGIRI